MFLFHLKNLSHKGLNETGSQARWFSQRFLYFSIDFQTVPVDSDPHGYKDATFYLLPHGSNRGMPLLIDSFGYSYTTKVGRWERCNVCRW